MTHHEISISKNLIPGPKNNSKKKSYIATNIAYSTALLLQLPAEIQGMR